MNSQLPTRRLIPRWRRVAATLSLAEGQTQPTKQLSAPVSADAEDFDRAIEEWNADPTAGHLGHVLAFSVADETIERVRLVAQDAVRRGNLATPMQEKLISTLFATRDEDEDWASVATEYSVCNPHTQRQMRETRSLLAANPANPLVLLDFAQLQLASGKWKRAERSLLAAQSLSPNNRLILRTLARFYVHRGLPDKAHRLLAKHRKTPFDPWLMASEIAVSQAASIGSVFASRGLKAAREKRRDLSHITELAGAVAGLEMESGKWKHARDLFRLALVCPNDNVVAQVITDQKRLSLDLDEPEQRRVVSTANEARTLLAWRALNTEDAEASAFKWHAEEPFSSRPLHFLTALGAVQGRYKHTEVLSRRGLISDPNDAVLTANLSYALACLGELDEAEQTAVHAQSLGATQVTPQTTATLGLVAMKRRNFELSDALYAKALAQFEKENRKDLIAVCYAYYARAAVELEHPQSLDILRQASERYTDAPTIDAALILRQLKLDLESPAQDEPSRRLSQWIYDAKTNSLIKKPGVTAVGAPALVIRSDKKKEWSKPRT